MRTPEYETLWRKLHRYGQTFDISVDKRSPQPLVKTKAGKIAKRQPAYEQRPKAYYQAQCSFRGLKTSGTKEELQQFLQLRDVGKDLTIKQDLDQAELQVETYQEYQEANHFEQYWQSLGTDFDQKLANDPQRALQEEMQKPDSRLLRSYSTYVNEPYDLSRAAKNLGLAYVDVQEMSEVPPGCDFQRCQIIGEATAVDAHAKEFMKTATQKVKEQWSSWNARVEAAKAAKQAQHQALQAEAKAAQDWNLTGLWTVHCNELACYSSERPERLTMEIFKDDFNLNDVCGEDVESEARESYYAHYGEYGYRNTDERPARPKPKEESAAELQRPRFCAKFNFAVVEGIMRIYPLSSAANWTTIQGNPTFEYRWRGRETGESEIQNGAQDYLQKMTFSDYGTKFEGVFHCTYTGPLRITGTKTAHGRGQVHSSAEEWSGLGEDAWDDECRSRWH